MTQNAPSSNEYWEAPPLSGEDLQLIALYRQAGRSLDDLPYTPEFEKLAEQAGGRSPEAKHAIWARLLRLRKTGRLPRVGSSAY